MKVVMVTGSYPPDICGVADYTSRLSEALQKKGISVSVFTGKQWDIANSIKLRKEILSFNANIVHIQYPTTGYGHGLAPQLLSLLNPFVVTIHECSQAHVLRRASLYPFTIRAKSIILTDEYERNYLQRLTPWIKSKSVVIPIGANIPIQSGNIERRANVITYFGLIRPQKGLERVIEAARLLKSRGSRLTVRIIGTVMPGHERYYTALRSRSEGLSVDWQLGLSNGALSHALAQTSIAYLPIPDGASERRSTLIAMLSNGAAVITTKGLHTPPSMYHAVLFSNSVKCAVSLAERIACDTEELDAQSRRAVAYASKYDWDHIAEEHISIYQRHTGLIDGYEAK
jgi:glycosyltransferase involved in cell wall biosynthesis